LAERADWTGSADEAEDALQRAMEIYVRRLDSIDAATELSWRPTG
jgi:hypothetical protein